MSIQSPPGCFAVIQIDVFKAELTSERYYA